MFVKPSDKGGLITIMIYGKKIKSMKYGDGQHQFVKVCWMDSTIEKTVCRRVYIFHTCCVVNETQEIKNR